MPPYPGLKLTEILSNKITVSTLEYYEDPTQKTNGHAKQIDYEMWAYPDGIKIYNNRLQILNDSEPEYSFFEADDLLTSNVSKSKPPEYIYSFVLTDYDLNRTYCTCIIWNVRYATRRKDTTSKTTGRNCIATSRQVKPSVRDLVTT